VNPVVVDLSGWGQLRVTGADRLRFLQGMLTNDVAALAPGGFLRAAVLNVKGRVLAVVDVVREDDSFVLLTEPVTADKLHQLLDRHAIADDVAFTPEARPCHRIWDTPASVWTASPRFAPPASPSSAEEVEVRRVEGGLPRYGADVSEDYFPFEANLDAAISSTKGCYIGQEVVARASARGHANKRLVGLRLDGPVAPGTPLVAETRPQAGVVTSAVGSPLFGPIALGYLHRTVWEPGTVVTAGERRATVAALPFTPA
jgi:tRNA-modifying protein YgfZ